MGMDHSSLSRFLGGQRDLSDKIKMEICSKLGLRNGMVLSAKPLNEYHSLSSDQFSVICDWYHFALLELMEVREFSKSPKWIASALGITVSEAKFAIERLKRLGVIEEDLDGRLKNKNGFHSSIEPGVTDVARRTHQRQVLEKSIEALANVPLDERNHTSMTVAANSKRLPEVITRIAKFRRELTRFLEKDQVRDRVYQIQIGFFPVSQTNKSLKKRSK